MTSKKLFIELKNRNIIFLVIEIYKDNNYKVTSSEDRSKPDLLFIISSTRKYFWIIKNK